MPDIIKIGDKEIELKTWDDVKSFDDIVIEEEKDIIKELEKWLKTEPCSCLAKEGDFFYYCDKGIDTSDKIPSPTNPIYQRKLGCVELQLWCMGNFERCVRYQEE